MILLSFWDERVEIGLGSIEIEATALYARANYSVKIFARGDDRKLTPCPKTASFVR